MKKPIWMIVVVVALACSSRRQTAVPSMEDPATTSPATGRDAVPPCILKMIDSAKTVDPGLSITEVRRYVYNGSKVYLVGAPCCDQFDALYDSACHYLFAPSGGITGKGDGSHPGFFEQAKADSLIWKRKNNE